MTVTVTLDLPHDAASESYEQLATRLLLLWAIDEVRQGRLTRPRAAKLLGLGLDEFLRRAARHGLDAIDYDLDDFRRELAGAQ
jgi:predicted HTH domain antitoxin